MKKIDIHKLRYKMIIVFSIFILIPVIISGFLSYQKQSEVIYGDYVKYKERINKQIINSIEENILSLETQSAALFVNPSDALTLVTTSNDKINASYLNLFNSTKSYILSLLDTNPSIRGVSLIAMNGEIKQYVGNNFVGLNLQSVKNEEWFVETIAQKGVPYIVQPHYNSFEVEDKKNRRMIVSVAKAIVDLDSFQVYGVILIDQDIAYLSQILNSAEMEQGEAILIYDKNGDVIYQNQQVDARESAQMLTQINSESGVQKCRLTGKEMLISSDYSHKLDWRIVSAVPMTIMDSKTSYVKKISITSVIIQAFLIFIISSAISFLITRSLTTLSKSIRELEKGNFDTNVDIKGKDEIAQIGHAFNEMVYNLKNLIDQKYKLELLRKGSEISALQSQINPHFLFNTLNSMKAVADRENSPIVVEMIQSLSDNFRYCMTKGRQMVSFDEELEHVENYLYLQEYRYHGKYKVIYNIPGDMLKAQVPRLILQPIVENAINYGLENRTEQGEIIIAAQRINKQIYIYISDNGKGISENVLKELNVNISKKAKDFTSADFVHIGISNVNARIKLMFGDEYGVSIYSVENEKTTIKLTLPDTLE